MFEQSLLVGSSGAAGHTNRGWTTAASLVVQIFIISALALVPMLYPTALQYVQRPPQIPIFSSAPPHMQAQPTHQYAAPSTEVTYVPSNNALHIGHPEQPTDVAPSPTGFDLPQSGPNLAVISEFEPPRIVPPKPTKPLVISHPDPASLLHQVQPVYPAIARQARMEGTVVLHALITKEGTIASLQVMSGHPFLAPAAVEAVRQWRYRPYILNGDPVEIETQITVNFVLGKN